MRWVDGVPPRLSPSRVDPSPSAWRQITSILDVESRRRERRLRRSLALADLVALAIGLLASVVLLSPDPLTPFVLLLFPALVAAVKILGLYESDDQRIRKTTVEELPQLARVGALLVLTVWLGDRQLIGGPAGKDQALVLGLAFVAAAVLGRRTARRLANSTLAPERCLFVGDALSYARLRTIFDRHKLGAELVARIPIEQAMGDATRGRIRDQETLLEIISRAEAHRLIIGPHNLTTRERACLCCRTCSRWSVPRWTSTTSTASRCWASATASSVARRRRSSAVSTSSAPRSR